MSKQIKIPKNKTIIGVDFGSGTLSLLDSNKIIAIKDNRDGHKGTADYYLTSESDEEIEIQDMGFVDVPFNEFKIEWL